MKREIFFLTMIILLSSIVSAIDMCTSTPFVNTQCQMVTPVVSCSNLSYIIYDSINGDLVKNNSLTLLNDSVYYFNFTQDVGDYLVVLCDDTTREVRVGKEDDNVGWISIVFVLGLMAVMFSVFSFKINDERLNWAKLLMFLLGVLNVFLMGFLPYIISANPGNIAAFKPMAIGYLSVNGGLLVYFIWMYGAHLFLNLFRANVEKQNNENTKDKM